MVEGEYNGSRDNDDTGQSTYELQQFTDDFSNLVQLPLWENIKLRPELRRKHTVMELASKAQMKGVSSLSDDELLVIVLDSSLDNTGIVAQTQTLLENFTLQELLRTDFGELSFQYSLGTVKATQLQAILEVARRLTIPPLKEGYVISSVGDVVKLLRSEMAFLDHEEMRVLLLDTRMAVVANELLYKGTVSSSVVSPAEIFRSAITRKCPKIILCHNHPAGSIEPSEEDIEITKQCVEAARILDVELVDHIIVGGYRHISLKERIRW